MDAEIMKEVYQFQGPGQLRALWLHEKYVAFWKIVFFPFRWLAKQMTGTHVFEDYNRPRKGNLTLVK